MFNLQPTIIKESEILTGWYQQKICENLIIRGTKNIATSVECKEGGACTELKPNEIAVEYGQATPKIDAASKAISCSRRNLS